MQYKYGRSALNLYNIERQKTNPFLIDIRYANDSTFFCSCKMLNRKDNVGSRGISISGNDGLRGFLRIITLNTGKCTLFRSKQVK